MNRKPYGKISTLHRSRMPSTFYDMNRMDCGKQLGRVELPLVRTFPVVASFPTDELSLVPTAANLSCGYEIFSLDWQATMHQELC